MEKEEKMVTSKEYPESVAQKTWEKGGLTFSIVQHEEMGHYCGYVRFPKRPVRERDYNGILIYVPVHGGITYAKKGKGKEIVYGFDCAHAGDEGNALRQDTQWLTAECERMAHAIEIAAKYEKRYLSNITNKGKAKVLGEYHEELKAYAIEFHLQDNLGVMINVLTGQL